MSVPENEIWEERRAPQPTTGDVPDQIDMWSIYAKHRPLVDAEWMEEWKGLADKRTTIFSGLLSVMIVTCLRQTLRQAELGQSQRTVAALETVSLQLKSIAYILQNSSNPSIGLTEALLPPQPYVAKTGVANHTTPVANILWTLALVLSLMCAMGSLLVQSWLRTYQARIDGVDDIRAISRRRYYMHQGFKKYGVHVYVATIPAMLHASVFLFLAGLTAYLRSTNHLLGNVTLVLVSIFGGVYLVVSILGLFLQDWPYDTPISMVIKVIWRELGYVDLD
ncbi:hypothetical protein BDN72DRAFT_896071 [Pluteus cervinus]|uniref:Uncharacterized protein n=1 Tax=Pluteus cervinus TaxID=181527 RepID=A0ACD3AZP2_9AGAR|nr:hypothetical protein BDN72DRAFT_896071 [Pluteus cervinus]